MKSENTLLRIQLSMAGTACRDQPQGAHLSISKALLSKLQDLKCYLATNAVSALTIEGEPDCWLPHGIDSHLRFSEVVMIVSKDSFWFRATSACLDMNFTTRALDIDAVAAECARQSIRRAALEPA